MLKTMRTVDLREVGVHLHRISLRTATNNKVDDDINDVAYHPGSQSTHWDDMCQLLIG
jgi:hypothetical protein